MKKELLWNLFEKTGKIEYYLKYKEESKKGEQNGSKGKWDLSSF